MLKNNSEFDLTVSVNIDFFDENGSIIGTDSETQYAFEAGTETIFVFIPDEKFEKMEYELDVEKEEWFETVVSDLSYEVFEAENKVILAVTNNGEKAAEFVEGHVLFFNGEIPVGHDYHYFIDNDSELKPGKTIKQEMTCYEDFDNVKVYLMGRRSLNNQNKSAPHKRVRTCVSFNL
ncbi:MAG: hypothetical protein ACOX7I_01925 [Oscillospiraceae bacterium]